MKYLFILCSLFFAINEASAYNVWNQKTNCPGVARHRTTAFSIGSKGYIGLGHYNSGAAGNTYLKDYWEYDPASDSWTQKADFGGGWRYHAIGFSYGGKGYVGTGQGSATQTGSGAYYTNDLWEFDPIANTWTAKSSFPGSARRGAVCFVIGDYAFVGTGAGTADFYAYDIPNDQWLGGIPSLPASGRTSAVAFSIGDKGYVGTGGSGCGTTDFYEYKMSTNSWIARANVGTMIRQESFGFSVNGYGYIVAGDNCSSGTNYKDMWEYDPTTDTWTQLDDFAGAARRYPDGFVIGNKAYVGFGTSGVNYNDLWEYDQLLSVISRDQSYLEINSYPNPVTTYVDFELNNLPNGMNFSDVSLELYNSSGKLVNQQKFENNAMRMERNGLPNGLYIYTIVYEGNYLKQGKLIFN